MPRRLPHWNTADVSELLPFARARLLAVDLDGTLVSSDISKVFDRIEVLRTALEHPRYRMHMTVATGRTYAGASRLIERLRVPAGVPLILYNGSVVAHRSGHLLVRREIPVEALIRIVSHCRTANICCLAYFFAPEAIGSDREYVLGWMGVPPYAREFNGTEVVWNSELPAEVGPSAILLDVRTAPSRTDEIVSALKLLPGVSITASGSAFVEIRPAGSSKALALEAVAAELSIPREAVVALGDNDNDAEMLAWAGIGVAVSSASQGALRAAGYQCTHGVARGAVELLRLIREAKRYYGSAA